MPVVRRWLCLRCFKMRVSLLILQFVSGDSGSFRSIVDTIVTMTAPTMAITSPSIAVEFARLSGRCQKFKYGSHSMHVIHMFFPDADDYQGLSLREPCGLLFFVVSNTEFNFRTLIRMEAYRLSCRVLAWWSMGVGLAVDVSSRCFPIPQTRHGRGNRWLSNIPGF